MLVLVVSCTAVFAQSDLQPLATIKLNKTESVTLKQLKSRAEIYKKQTGLTSFTMDQKKEILDSLIDERLVLQAAAKAGMVLTESQGNELFLQSLASFVGQSISEADYAAVVKSQTGLTMDQFFMEQVAMNVADYKTFLKNQYIAQQYVLMQKQAEFNNISATDAEIRAYYELNKASLVQSDMLKAFLVVVPKDKDAAKAKALIDQLYSDYKSNKLTFDQLTVKAQAKDSGFQAGDILLAKNASIATQLGIDYTTLLNIFQKNVGTVSDVIDATDEYEFFIVREKYDAKILTLSDSVQPGTNVTVYEYIKSGLTNQKQSEYLPQATKEVTESLRTAENYQMVKTGDALDKLLSGW